MATRYSAQLDGIGLDIETLDDSFEKAVARYEYPFANAADLDDMGMKARSIRFRCYFMNEMYDMYPMLVEHMKLDRIFQLVHPVEGILYGRIESWSVHHDDRIETAEIDLVFVEEREGAQKLPIEERILPEIEEQFVAAQIEQAAVLTQDIEDEVGTALASDIVNKELDPSLGILAQFSGIDWRARSLISQIDTDVTIIDSMMSTVSNPPSSILETMDFGTELPGRVLGSIASAVERYAESAAGVTSGPSQFLANLRAGVLLIEDSVSSFLKPHVRSVGAQYAAVRLASIYSDDEELRQRQRRLEGVPAFDVTGNYLRTEASPDVLTINEVERSLEIARQHIQESIDDFRSVSTMKAMARSLLVHVNSIKLEREKIVDVEITDPTSLHIICLQHSLPYQYAERIVKINPEIQNPTFTQGTIQIYAR